MPKYVIVMIPNMENCGHSDVDSMLLILQDILNGLSEKNDNTHSKSIFIHK